MTTSVSVHPVGSTDLTDLIDNLNNFDVAVNSDDDIWIDRRGNVRPT